MGVAREEVDLFEKLVAEMRQLHAEMAILSKSKPDNPVNKFKLLHINDKLADANRLLVDRHKPLRGFDQFSEDDIPTNSDVVIVLSQYLEGLEGWRSAHVTLNKASGRWHWDTDKPDMRSDAPTRFRRNS